ncbi:3-ketoacyl-(acyl-carrier) reductase (macronuclear) [Tetrahymena thermophila SB210]|uniref:3-oxoacyl-[acyl-carrier-protein] reductase n=1 Tax=Tetrahymena thermophila (strain SB210) TaxID=312017 RepID=I7LXX1_TETTS|nr:3-ketoacyl-(acyl-carrier) reductase [Tetrahymena thermophila SB210]EAS06699.1 3-ketoacyl-(acyl-carrier) reductase [Tetrahymena thermophila SB210]|eukprot:XP_001026941.1 3-ketoacyl-(acyl-carrier) reductase [Tetrahymena thermophila SB210]
MSRLVEKTIKTAMVTGASSGIGLSTAKYFCEKGIRVVANGLDKNIQGFKHDLLQYNQIDLANEKERIDYLKMVSSQHQGVDILVNNAGRFDYLSIEDTSMEIFQSQIEINLKAPLALIQHFLPYMKKQKYGRIINVASQKGIKGGAYHSAYCSTKHGIVGLTKAVALELAQEGITCNAICPGWVSTPPVMGEIQKLAQQNKISLEEQVILFLKDRKAANTILTKPEDIAASIYFLTTDSASQITGTTLSHDSANSAD